jgi:hypothetical protein
MAAEAAMVRLLKDELNMKGFMTKDGKFDDN